MYQAPHVGMRRETEGEINGADLQKLWSSQFMDQLLLILILIFKDQAREPQSSLLRVA